MDELEVLKILARFCRAEADLTVKLMPGNRMTFLHARFADGTVVTVDEGKVTIAHAELGQITFEELEAHIGELERDAR
jgi:trans-aconitate methyltransferase